MSWDTLIGNQEECVRAPRHSLCTVRPIYAVVYLFLINYGRTKPESIHMVIPNFLQVL